MLVTEAGRFIEMHAARRLLVVGHEMRGRDNPSDYYYDVRLEYYWLEVLQKNGAVCVGRRVNRTNRLVFDQASSLKPQTTRRKSHKPVSTLERVRLTRGLGTSAAKQVLPSGREYGAA